ncbi:MAG: DUF5518 domain-containing protein [Methanobrevibacter sp.]|nr:DUF5518 domain-containing protein [Methanobrevibacter sp.]
MIKYGPVLIGFILSVLVKMIMGPFELLGLFAVGFLVGYVVKEGAYGGMVNAATAGALGGIIGGILFMILGVFFGVAGLIIFGISGFIAILGYLIYYGVIMGISGAIGGIIAEKNG